MILSLLIAIFVMTLLCAGYLFFKHTRSAADAARFELLLSQLQKQGVEQQSLQQEQQLHTLKILQESIQLQMQDVRSQLQASLQQQSAHISENLGKLTTQTTEQLRVISTEVDKRLQAGFEKTQTTFTDVVKRLALIDEAQKRISELSTNVVSLQEILSDKRSRGAFGEVQLTALVRNIFPENAEHYQLQYHLKTHPDRIADCMLFLPPPTGNIAIDAKFPLESFRLLQESAVNSIERKQALSLFQKDIKKHIQDIAQKYICPPETADGAILFLPAEAIFAEIHAHHPDLVHFAQTQQVWLASPTTLMAILTTARAVIKDAATRQQIHAIQTHLIALAKDFSRFQDRMENLTKALSKASKEADDARTSARKLTSRFEKIERVELGTGTETEPEKGAVLAVDE